MLLLSLQRRTSGDNSLLSSGAGWRAGEGLIFPAQLPPVSNEARRPAVREVWQGCFQTTSNLNRRVCNRERVGGRGGEAASAHLRTDTASRRRSGRSRPPSSTGSCPATAHRERERDNGVRSEPMTQATIGTKTNRRAHFHERPVIHCRGGGWREGGKEEGLLSAFLPSFLSFLSFLPEWRPLKFSLNVGTLGEITAQSPGCFSAGHCVLYVFFFTSCLKLRLMFKQIYVLMRLPSKSRLFHCLGSLWFFWLDVSPPQSFTFTPCFEPSEHSGPFSFFFLLG